MVFFSLFFFCSLSDFVDITRLFFGGTEILELTQTKVVQQPDCGNGHTLTTLQFLKINAKCKTPAKFNVQMFEKYS